MTTSFLHSPQQENQKLNPRKFLGDNAVISRRFAARTGPAAAGPVTAGVTARWPTARAAAKDPARRQKGLGKKV
jgi:hypothetical protein